MVDATATSSRLVTEFVKVVEQGLAQQRILPNDGQANGKKACQSPRGGSHGYYYQYQ